MRVNFIKKENNTSGQGNTRCKVLREKGTWSMGGTERQPVWLKDKRGESDMRQG